MYGIIKHPGSKLWKQETPDSSNPFDSDTDPDNGRLDSGRTSASKPLIHTSSSAVKPLDEENYRIQSFHVFKENIENSSRNPGKKVPKPRIADPSNPFDTDNESETEGMCSPRITEPPKPTQITSAYGKSASLADKYRYKNNFWDTGGLQCQATEELENYAIYKATETTGTIKGCLKIAEDIREDGTRTLEMLHQQGQNMRTTHLMAVEVDKNLSRGERLLKSLGGMFSRSWKPTKTREIAGPQITSDHPSVGIENRKEQRENLGLSPSLKARYSSRTSPPEPRNAMQKVEVEETKQDDALSDLSNILGDLKSMAADMGCELSKQNEALDYLHDDVDELNARVRGANLRTRRLLGK